MKLESKETREELATEFASLSYKTLKVSLISARTWNTDYTRQIEKSAYDKNSQIHDLSKELYIRIADEFGFLTKLFERALEIKEEKEAEKKKRR